MAKLTPKQDKFIKEYLLNGGNGTQAAGLLYGGNSPGTANFNNTEEFTYADGVVLTFDVS